MTTRDSTTAPASSFGLLAATRYVPRLRLERPEMLAQHRWMAPGLRGLAKGQRAIASWDEDSVTMAVEAGRRLARALPQATVDEFTLASTTLPFADRLNAGIVAAALGLDPSARVRDVASSSRAALGELAAALQGPHSGATQETIRTCLAAANVNAGDVAHFAMPAPLARVNDAVAKRLGVPSAALVSTEHETVGDLGGAQPLAMLDIALRAAAPGAPVLVAAFGSGCDALLLRRTAAPCPGAAPDAGRAETSYLKYLSFTGQIDLEWGMRAEMDNKTALTAAWRDHSRAARFEAGQCSRCGTVQFPKSLVCVNPECRAQQTQTPTSLADVPARVLSHTSDFLAYTPNPPFQFGHIDFEGGGRVLMEFADCDVDELKVGLPLRMVYRVKDFDRNRGFRRYFWKATPDRAAAAAVSSTGAN